MALNGSKEYHKAISNSHLAVSCILSYFTGKADSGTFLINLQFVNTGVHFNKLKAIPTYSNPDRKPEPEKSKYPLPH